MALQLALRQKTSVPLEVEGVVPNAVREMPLDDVRRMPIYHGNRQLELGEFFDVSGDPADAVMHWEGDLSGVHWIGAKMRDGVIRISGKAGRHLGSEMRGGQIHVEGDAGDWVGGEMHGGLIQIRGSAGHLVGAAYRGSARGMTGGTILIGGRVGNELGHTLRRGMIAVAGSAGDLVGFNMLAGTILVFGEAGIRPGAAMRRGTIGFFGQAPPLLLSFRHACRYAPEVLALLGQYLRRHEFPAADAIWPAQVDLFHGDLIEGGRGEILIRA